MTAAYRSPRQRSRSRGSGRDFMWDILTFDRLMTGPLVHLIYWCGLGLIALVGFGIVGGTVGITLRGGEVTGLLLAIVALVAGLLGVTIMALVWRGVCEFFVAVFQISDDLRALRAAQESQSPAPPMDRV